MTEQKCYTFIHKYDGVVTARMTVEEPVFPDGCCIPAERHYAALTKELKCWFDSDVAPESGKDYAESGDPRKRWRYLCESIKIERQTSLCDNSLVTVETVITREYRGKRKVRRRKCVWSTETGKTVPRIFHGRATRFFSNNKK